MAASARLTPQPPTQPEPEVVPTCAGPATVEVDLPRGTPRGLVVLGHGAGGDRTDRVLVAVASALSTCGLVVARFDQPYRVSGRRAPAPAPTLDAAAAEVVASLRGRWPDVRLLLGGRSSGARVACRIATGAGAAGVIALGFPLRPPWRPDQTRAHELDAAAVPVVVCQGERDVFGTPEDVRAAASAIPDVSVHAIAAADHSFAVRRSDRRTAQECLAEVASVVREWVVRQTGAT